MRSKGQIMNTKYLSKMTYWPCYIIIYIFSIFLTFYYLCINLWFRNPIEIYEVLLYASTNKFSFITNDIKTNFSSTYTFYNILLGLSAVYLYVQIIPLFIYVNKDSMSNSFDCFDIHHFFDTMHYLWCLGPSWLSSYGSWIYSYLWNRCISPQTLWVWIPLRRGVLDTTLCDKVCQWLATGQWFSLGAPVSSTKKTDCHDIAEILLKVVLKHHNPNWIMSCHYVDFIKIVFWHSRWKIHWHIDYKHTKMTETLFNCM